MGTQAGPNISDNAIAFEYDSANVLKSWRGAPTTNLITIPNGGVNVYSLDGLPSEAIAGGATGYGSYSSGYSVLTLATTNVASTGKTFTFSVWLKSDGGISTYLMYVSDGTGSDGGWWNFGSGTLTSEWKKYTYTVSGMTGTVTMVRIYRYNQLGTIDICAPQFEEMAYATPFVVGTRTSSQNVVDLLNTTATTTYLTYNTDGTFKFNGANNMIYTGTTFFPMPTFTLETWHRSPGLGSGMTTCALWGITYGIVGNIYGDGTVSFNTYNTDTSTYFSAISTTGTTLLDNNWHHVVYVVNSTNSYIYIDGVLNATATNSGTWSGTNVWSGQAPLIGNNPNNVYYRFNGEIPVARVYKRAITAEDVRRNYNALKERFFGYQKMNYINNTNVTLTNNGTEDVTMFKTASADAWNSHVYSLEPFTAPCTIEFTKNAGATDNISSYAMIGWNADPLTDQSYSSLDWASYPYMTNAYCVYHNGTSVLYSGAWDPNKRFYIVYDTDGYIRHYNGSTLLYSVNKGTGMTVYFDSSFYSVNSTYGGFSNVKVCRKSWNGYTYV